MDKLNQVSHSFSLVLNDNELHLFKDARYIRNKFMTGDYSCSYFACIYHDKDIDDDGNLKTPHFHVVLDMLNRMRVGTMISYVSDLFHCNENQISCEKCNDIGAQTRYLVHLDDCDKYPYSELDIVTSSPNAVKEFLLYFQIRSDMDLLNLIDRYPSRKEIFKRIGAKQYKKYSFIIRDLIY